MWEHCLQTGMVFDQDPVTVHSRHWDPIRLESSSHVKVQLEPILLKFEQVMITSPGGVRSGQVSRRTEVDFMGKNG